jgi:hypothetical protein
MYVILGTLREGMECSDDAVDQYLHQALSINLGDAEVWGSIVSPLRLVSCEQVQPVPLKEVGIAE